jgi:hypothetical protein
VGELEAQLRAANIETSPSQAETRHTNDSSRCWVSYQDGVHMNTTTAVTTSKTSPSTANTQFYGLSSTYYFVHCVSSYLRARDFDISGVRTSQTLIPNSASRSMVHAICSPDAEADESPASGATNIQRWLTEDTLSGKNLSVTQEAFFLDLFWDSWHCCYQILDETEFKAYYKSLWADPACNSRKPSALVDIVLALCMQYGVTTLPRRAEGGAEIDYRDAAIAGRWLYQRCQRLLVFDLERPSIETLQCQLWSAVYLANASYQNMAQNMMGVAARTAYTLGLHVEPSNDLPIKEQEARKRTWCTLLLFETRSCIRLGRPWVTHTQQVLPFLPTEDKTLIAHGVTWLSYTTQRTKFTEMVRVIFDEVLHHRSQKATRASATNPDATEMTQELSKVIATGMNKMRDWAESVPLALRTERRQGGKPFSTDFSEIEIEPFAPLWLRRQRLMLELGYHELMLTIGRSCMSQSLNLAGRSKNPPIYTSCETTEIADASALHAAATTKILHQTYKEHDILNGWYEPFNCQWNATITLVGFLLLYHNNSPVSSVAYKALDQSIEVLERMGDFFGTAASATLVAKDLYQRVRMPLDIPLTVSDSNQVAVPNVFSDHERVDLNGLEAFSPSSQDILGTFGSTFQLDQFGVGPESQLRDHTNDSAVDDISDLGVDLYSWLV